MQSDPRVGNLIAKYALAKGDFLLKRRAQSRFVHPEVFAGWALSQTQGDPMAAIETVKRMALPRGQRREVIDVLRPLLTVLDLTKPRIVLAHR